MLVLMNSAMCPQEGTYKVKRIDEKEAKNIFNTFKTRGWTSYVGYESTAKYMEKVLGEYIPVNRDTAKLEPKDVILVCKLPYRVNPKYKKNSNPDEQDFEWWLMQYDE